jgi:hypothetical protein
MKVLAQVFSLSLVLSIFLSTTGFVWHQHYCQDKLKSQSFFVKPKSCHELNKQQNTSCPMHVNQGMNADEEKNCCDNKVSYLFDNSDKLIQKLTLKSFDFDEGIAFSPAHVLIMPETDNYSIHYLNYKPPLILCDVPSTLQSFLL